MTYRTRLLKARYRPQGGAVSKPTTVRDADHALDLERYFGRLVKLGWYEHHAAGLVLVQDVTDTARALRLRRRRGAA